MKLPIHTFLTADSVQFDGVYIAGGQENAENLQLQKAATYIMKEAFSHYKTIAAA
ncbi:hypothetical protein [Bacillus sp. V59.32b]|uniref:hypothetical protein n=1 Tax=Bacillus sp. V59.32b TaxID=1758642 RepID=UPI00135AA62F|nr:hypothetical protein [Bacillus sp. V59.32b]